MKYLLLSGCSASSSCARSCVRCSAQPSEPADGPAIHRGGELIRPADFREWMFVTSGPRHDLQPAGAGAARTPNFTNVYVNPSSYRAFMKTGQWPDKTMFILEIRASTSEGSINKGGHFQSNLVVIEASVKDEARFPGKWAYFDFGRDMKTQVAALPRTERCYACHRTTAPSTTRSCSSIRRCSKWPRRWAP